MPTPQTEASSRFRAFDLRRQGLETSPFAELKPENIGPTVFSGRVTDLEADPTDPTKIYVAYASGGLWFSNNNGTTFTPVFDHQASMTIGDIAVDWKRSIIWIGTGESNSSRSSYAGTGLYRSADGGKNWEHRGLPESHHIGRVVLHPDNPDVLWVAALGHLYTPNADRGIFKTSDGGRTWQKTLFVDDTTGAIDLVIDPINPEILYAATWQRTRKAWHFNGAGQGSGVWKSVDGGLSWTRMNTPSSGFPAHENVGRIGLAAGLSGGKTVLYASLDNQAPKPLKDKKAVDGLSKDQLRSMPKTDFLALSDEKISAYLKSNKFPEKYTAPSVKKLVQEDQITPQALVEYLEDANTKLFETNFTGAEVYRSDDGGLTWKRTHADPLEQINFTYGYYFSNVRCQPDSADQVYLLGFFIIKSSDGGKTWENINGDNVHVDHHALWLNPVRPGHLINGNDGGVNISWDNGKNWINCNSPAVGQFYAVAVDSSENYQVYAGAQDNGVWAGPSNYKWSPKWYTNGRYPYESLLGGDGMQIAVDPRDPNRVYTGFQFGNYFRIDRRGGRPKNITPQHELGERPLRFNWQTPIHLSRHQPDILYIGAHRVYRSLDRGDHWQALSGDLTGGPRVGNVPFGTITTLDESPLHFGLLYVGTDDGRIHVSRNGGETWTRIDAGLPQNLWVSRVQASHHNRGRVFVSLNGYRNDDFAAYVFQSDDYGKTWIRLGANLPAEPVNVIREDPANPDLLWVGTDHNLYASLDGGETFGPFSPELPAVAVHDLALHRASGDLIIGTHGRSMYKTNIKPLQQLTLEEQKRELVIFSLDKIKFSENWGKKQPWKTPKDPEINILFYSKSAGTVRWRIESSNDLVLNRGEIKTRAGLNRLIYPLDVRPDMIKKYSNFLEDKTTKKPIELIPSDTGKIYLRPGTYKLILEKNNIIETKTFVVE